MPRTHVDRRDFLRYSLLAAGYSLSAGGILIAPLVNALGKVPKKLKDGESIFTLSGKVRVDGKSADSKTMITPDSKIETGSNSQLVFVVGKDAHILRENSQLTLTKGNSQIESSIKLAQGKILSVFGKRKADEVKLNVKTTTATIGIRGTGVYFESHEDHSYVCTCYGQTSISSVNDSQSKEIVTTKHHDSPRYITKDGKPGQFIQAAPVKNHTDEELMIIEALVGRAPPFSSLMSYDSPRRGY